MSFTPAPLLLKPIRIPDLPRLLDVGTEGMNLGRDQSNKIVISGDQFPHVSGQHARVETRGGELVLVDLGSKNGTYVNGDSIESHPLRDGDVIQLGTQGPQFLVVLRNAAAPSTVSVSESEIEAASVPEPEDSPEGDSSIGDQTLLRVKSALGIPAGSNGVSDMLRTRARVMVIVASVMFILLLAAGAVGYVALESRQAELDELAGRVTAQEAKVADERRQFLDREQNLLAELEELRNAREASTEEMQRLQRELEATRRAIDGSRPELPEVRVGLLREVRQSVVLIETRASFRRGERELFVDRRAGGSRFNLDGIGDPVTHRETGSGFCVSPQGWIMTNLHVVAPAVPPAASHLGVVAAVEVKVVFEGSSTRHGGRVVPPRDPDVDLALVKITPYPGMPWVRKLDLDAPVPTEVSSVYLMGYPYGTEAMQDRDAVSVSTFDGIVSRYVEGYLQITTGVYPGTSGGPVLDEEGRVIAVVTGVQKVPKGAGIASHIGYALPIARARAVWPPAESSQR